MIGGTSIVSAAAPPRRCDRSCGRSRHGPAPATIARSLQRTLAIVLAAAVSGGVAGALIGLDLGNGDSSYLTRAFDACFSPHTHGSGFAARDLAALAVWGVVGAVVAVRRFTIETADGEDVGRPWLRRPFDRAAARSS
jgi:hypothetical protein